MQWSFGIGNNISLFDIFIKLREPGNTSFNYIGVPYFIQKQKNSYAAKLKDAIFARKIPITEVFRQTRILIPNSKY